MKHCFENHVAELQDLGDIKVINWQNRDGSRMYHIRYIFDEKLCTMSVTGDCGAFVVRNYDNVCYEGIKDFFHSLDYFASKIKACGESVFVYTFSQAIADAKEILESREIDPTLLDNALAELDEMIFLPDHGFITNGAGLKYLPEADPCYCEWLSRCGRMIDPQIELILNGLEEAWNQLHEKKEEANG